MQVRKIEATQYKGAHKCKPTDPDDLAYWCISKQDYKILNDDLYMMEKAKNRLVSIIEDHNKPQIIKTTCKWYQFSCKKKERLGKEHQPTLSSRESGYP